VIHEEGTLAAILIMVFISQDRGVELRGFTPIGMVAHWNNGFWEIDGMGYCKSG
jgi:short subunit fatty acids transporter